ncbi:MAG: NUDIX hydrolase [Rhizobiaceae bacterium]|nr:NUDIX hydrolase [Rhizobiaceae bacterium]
MFTYQFPHMAVTVDLVLFHCEDPKPTILLIKRKNNPFENKWAVPGGYVDMGETIEMAAKRELLEETGMVVPNIHFFGYFDAIHRDPRERTISFAFWAQTTVSKANLKAGDDAGDAKWFELVDLPNLAFDHMNLVELAVKSLHKYQLDNE